MPDYRVYLYEKTTAPTVNDDETAGYIVGDNWLDTTSDNTYVAIDVTAGAAVWNLTNSLNITPDGWTQVTDSWIYASASTITVPSDATTTYQKWMRIRFKQGGGYKYFVVQSLSSTVLTVAVNTDYTVANAAITDVYYSFMDKPFGFPDEFNWTPGWTNLTVGSGTVTAKLKISSLGLIKGHVELAFSSTTISGSVSLTAPVTIGTYGGSYPYRIGDARFIDAAPAPYEGITLYSSGVILLYALNASSTYVGLTAMTSTAPFTWANTDNLFFDFEYFG